MEEKQPDVEKDVAEQSKKDEAIEDLNNIDLGLTGKDELDIAARERYQIAVAYKQLFIRRDTVKLSVKANEAVGNSREAENFRQQVAGMDAQMSHCLRGIREIDRQYPKAKERMQALIKAGV
jgi:hypothetical protein